MFALNPNPVKFARIVIRDDETPTAPNLAFDLRDMDALRERGVPISNQTLANSFYDGDTGESFDIPFETRRFVDVNDAWVESKTINEHFTKAKIKRTDLNPK